MPLIETPVGLGEGVSSRRDRRWGLIGGILGALVGPGSAAIAIFVEGANPFESGPYPRFFTNREFLVYDAYLAAVLAVGVVFAVGAIVSARRSRFPRTDAMGGALVGMILMLLGSALVFTRFIAVVRGS